MRYLWRWNIGHFFWIPKSSFSRSWCLGQTKLFLLHVSEQMTGHSTQSYKHRRKWKGIIDEKSQKHWKIQVGRDSSCHLVQVFPQSRANYTGFSGPCLGFYCLPGWRFPIPWLARFLSVLLAIFLSRWASHSPTSVHCVLSSWSAPPGKVWLHLPIPCHKVAEESRKITLSFCFLRLNKPSSSSPSLYTMFSRCPPIPSAEPPLFSGLF